jgi:hypothetical protein
LTNKLERLKLLGIHKALWISLNLIRFLNFINKKLFSLFKKMSIIILLESSKNKQIANLVRNKMVAKLRPRLYPKYSKDNNLTRPIKSLSLKLFKTKF